MLATLRSTLKQGDRIFFAVFADNGQIEVHEGFAHEAWPEYLTLQPDASTAKITGYIPYEWIGMTPLEAVRALRNRTIEKMFHASLEMKKLSEQSVHCCQKVQAMEEAPIS